MIDDHTITTLRRGLGPMLAQARGRMLMAANLLEPKVSRSPDSAEAHARKLLVDAIGVMERWLVQAADAGGIDRRELEAR